MGLTGCDATTVADHFSLGGSARLCGPVARGQLGQVWRLTSDAGSFAVKEWFAGPDPEDLVAAATFSDRLEAAGVATPSVVRTRSGEVTVEVDGTLVRVFEWVDFLAPTRRLDPEAVGRLIAAMHLAAGPATEPPGRWYAEGIGAQTWRELQALASAANAPFAGALTAQLDGLVAAETVIEPPSALLECHRDLWSDNLLRTRDDGLCVVDLESVGPADPGYELAMALFEYGLDDPDRARALHGAYVEAGGPGRVSRRADFSMLVATMAHLGQLACTRWIGANDPAVRAHAEALLDELLDDPVTLARIDRILRAVAS